ncbi:uncharacterized protein LOC132038497 [Lycium ferocissimum]|uniref:uncharacterized protein LOC132038497 n=1 Tax=Lycium ferocissimum TaxID=112874 RepID=UPI0028155919|nr:uncharacterized protein LOC132038497 [Lycium ferocissimum]
MEPFQQATQIQHYRRRLTMHTALSNNNGKVWVFIAENIEVEVLLDSSQQVTLRLFFQEFNQELITTLVYAKCDATERLELWDNIYQLANNITSPWIVEGDFNVVMNQEEKIGGFPVNMNGSEDFAFCVNSCELEEIQFKGTPFTWWNGRANNEGIFERLDRMLVNSQMQTWLGNMEVEHLARTGQIMHHSFALMVQLMLIFKANLKHLKGVFSKWSREVYVDLFKQLIIREEIFKIKEELFEEAPTAANRCVLQCAHAEYKRYLYFEEEYWRQKARVDWFVDGDRNTRFFHNLVRGRRRKLMVKKIQGLDGSWIEDRA